MELGELKKVDVRTVWKNEASDFTVWLSQEQNLQILGNEIDHDLVLVQTECPVGDFSADILAEEESTQKKIVIENQLARTNHDHLGKLITYASGHSAGIAVWVVSDVREEHRKAIDWLNDHTDEDVEFFLVRIEVWQIGNSPFAPKFEVICRPNDWARQVKKSSASEKLSETGLFQLEYWTRFKSFAMERKTTLKLQTPPARHWTSIGIGKSDAYISLTVNSVTKHIATELYIPNNKDLYEYLLAHKAEIEGELGEAAEWMELPERKASRIKTTKTGDFYDKGQWNEQFTWFLNEAQKFQKVFPKHIKIQPIKSSQNT